MSERHDSTAKRLLRNGTSPLYMAYENENDSNVKLLVNNGTDIDL